MIHISVKLMKQNCKNRCVLVVKTSAASYFVSESRHANIHISSDALQSIYGILINDKTMKFKRLRGVLKTFSLLCKVYQVLTDFKKPRWPSQFEPWFENFQRRWWRLHSNLKRK